MIANIQENIREHFFSNREVLEKKFPDNVVEKIIRLREEYNFVIDHPAVSDQDFVAQATARHNIKKSAAYADLAIIKTLLPTFHQSARDFHRWRYNEMIMKTYRMAEKRQDTKTMERCATSYAKFNRVDIEDEMAVPYDEIVVQPFTATSDPSELGIKRDPKIKEKIKKLIEEYRKENEDIEDVEYEEADLEEADLFPVLKDNEEEGLL